MSAALWMARTKLLNVFVWMSLGYTILIKQLALVPMWFCSTGVWEGHWIWRWAEQEKEQYGAVDDWGYGHWKNIKSCSSAIGSLSGSDDLVQNVLRRLSHSHCPGNLSRNFPGFSIVDLSLIFFLKIQYTWTIVLCELINYFSRFSEFIVAGSTFHYLPHIFNQFLSICK